MMSNIFCFQQVGYIPPLIDWVKTICAGLARNGRNSLRKAAGKSSGTDDVFFVAWRILYTSFSLGIQSTSDTN